jgi:hypothetical protein
VLVSGIAETGAASGVSNVPEDVTPVLNDAVGPNESLAVTPEPKPSSATPVETPLTASQPATPPSARRFPWAAATIGVYAAFVCWY